MSAACVSRPGAGVRICRTVGTGALRNLDPFLMLDEMRLPASQASAGFPAHPHRGFETCSIMFSGKIEHQDSVGNKVGSQLLSSCLTAQRISYSHLFSSMHGERNRTEQAVEGWFPVTMQCALLQSKGGSLIQLSTIHTSLSQGSLQFTLLGSVGDQ